MRTAEEEACCQTRSSERPSSAPTSSTTSLSSEKGSCASLPQGGHAWTSYHAQGLSQASARRRQESAASVGARWRGTQGREALGRVRASCQCRYGVVCTGGTRRRRRRRRRSSVRICKWWTTGLIIGAVASCTGTMHERTYLRTLLEDAVDEGPARAPQKTRSEHPTSLESRRGHQACRGVGAGEAVGGRGVLRCGPHGTRTYRHIA